MKKGRNEGMIGRSRETFACLCLLLRAFNCFVYVRLFCVYVSCLLF